MTWVEQLYVWNIFKGMLITFKHIFKKKATINYPEQKRAFSPVFRGLQILNRDEEGRENCTACGLCAVACPAEAKAEIASRVLPEVILATLGSPEFDELAPKANAIATSTAIAWITNWPGLP